MSDDRGERLLAAGEQVHALQLLARRLGEDLDALLALALGGGEDQAGAAAVEEPREHLLELLVHAVEGLLEALAARPG